MSTLGSASSIEDLQAAYDDNASYEEDGDAAKARVFLTACRILARRLAARVQKGDGSVALDARKFEEQAEEARRWLAVHGGTKTPDGTSGAGAGYTYIGFQGFRG